MRIVKDRKDNTAQGRNPAANTGALVQSARRGMAAARRNAGPGRARTAIVGVEPNGDPPALMLWGEEVM